MIWVLWDILIPLAASFALGTLLGWLIWSWHRKNHSRKESSSAIAHTVDSGVNGASDSDELQLVSGKPDPDPMLVPEMEVTALREMQKANVVLISERDEANQALEDLQLETQEMRDRLAELEAVTEESMHEDTPANAPLAATVISNDSLTVAAGLGLENREGLESKVGQESKDTKELELLRSDLKQLTETLDRERKARRATELELLNIKNRHDKLTSDFATTVTVAEHDNQISKRDEEIESLKQQLADLAQHQDKESVEEEANITNLEVEEQPKEERPEEEKPEVEEEGQSNNEIPDQVVTAEVVVPDSNSSISVAQAAGIEVTEGATESESPVVQNKKPTESSDIPKGWKVPEKKPSKKERDKLTDIKGVGPALEKILHECGIYYYQQVANLDKSGIDELQLRIPQFPGRIQRDKWVAQANVLQKKKYGESA